MEIKVKKLIEEAIIPKFAYESDAGVDLCAIEDFTLLPESSFTAPTGLSFEIPEGHVGLIWDKSGIATKRNIKTLGGVIDAGYRGEVKVGLINLGGETQKFKKGDKIAQMLIQRIEQPEFVEVETLEESERGDKGFGSSGHR